ncbi:MAG: ATP-binding protein [Bacteriovoracia bacterium]
MSQDRRPNPDELLSSIKKAEKRKERGHLRIFFGMCPGVGKTYSMLRAAQEQMRSGVKVAVGLVETHKRADTESLLHGMEIIPRKKIEYKGTVFEEMDIDRILKEKPPLVLVDELAHTNAPGSRHPKRYQDVEELLNSGINVYTTLNVQHIESRADLVQKITGVPIKETVPDSILEFANQLELIDLSPQELLKRLKEGKVYLGERAEQAAKNFFKEENLTALRELALRFTAEKVDTELKDSMTVKGIVGPWKTNERLMVAISHSPYSGRLIRAARRKAYNLEAPWIALYVDTGERLNEEDRETLKKNINLAKELGAEIVTTRDLRISNALKRVALEKNVSQIVMGRPDRRFFRDLLARGTVLDQLVRETSEIDVHVIRQERKPMFRGFKFPWPKIETGFIPYWNTLWFFFGVAFFSYAIKDYIGYRAVGFIFLLLVLVVASLSTFGPILFSAILSALVWNFFFMPPLYTFVISEPEDAMMCLVLFVVAIVAGYLTKRIRRQEADLMQREHRSNILYELAKEFAEAEDEKQIANRASNCIERLFNARVAILVEKAEGTLTDDPINIGASKLSEKDFAVATWCFLHKKKSGQGTDTLVSSKCLCLPLLGRNHPVGVLVLFSKKELTLSLDQENLLDTIANQLAITLERSRFEEQAQSANLLRESEKLHQTILNSVSHELRTPLTSIIGASTALQDPATAAREEARLTLTQELVGSADRLNRVVENLLDMSRLSSGVLTIKRELFDLNDLVRVTARRSERLFSNHKLELKLSQKDIFCEGDDRLLEHSLANLLVNAVTYSQPGTKITVTTAGSDGKAKIEVTDEGRGIPEAELGRIFDKFHRVSGSPPGGTGLGLSIAKSIVDAHGGSIAAGNRIDRTGATFTIELKTSDLPNNMLEGRP